jgi:hypothetical protein
MVGLAPSALAQVATATGSETATVTDAPSSAEDAPPGADDAGGWGAFEDAAAATAPAKIFETRLYGYLDTYFSTHFGEPTGLTANGDIRRADFSHRFDVLSLHAMVQGSIVQRFRYFINLRAGSAGGPGRDVTLGVRNAWVETSLVGDAVVLRLGKTYRRFGLYNEILDATPTFIGVEAPEYLDETRPIVTRTTNLMLHGKLFSTETWHVGWSLTTGDDERTGNAVPIGADLRATYHSALTLGSSFYWSGGDAVSGTAFGEGSPTGAVPTWMARDEYWVLGGFAQLLYDGLVFQAEVTFAQHAAARDPDAVRRFVDTENFYPSARARYFVDGNPAAGLGPLDVRFQVFTTYFRLGYELSVGTWTLTPYAGATYYSNPETLGDDRFGGDEEGSGTKDAGKFVKAMLGAVIRPLPQVALKLETTSHMYRLGGRFDWHQEGKLSLSYLWDLGL